jgi:hypothetical protein
MLENKIGLIAAFAIAIITLGCGGGGSAKNVAPIISSVTFPESVNEGDIINVSVSAEDPDGSIREFSWSRTYGPTIDFGDTATDRSAQFIAPEVSENTPLGLLVQVVDNDGAVSQEFMEIIILDTVQLNKIKVNKNNSNVGNDLLVNLEFDKQPLLNTAVNYSDLCSSGITIVTDNKNNCLSFNYKLIGEMSLQIEVQNIDLTQSYQLVISDKLLSVWEERSSSIEIDNLLDQKALMELNEKLSK